MIQLTHLYISKSLEKNCSQTVTWYIFFINKFISCIHKNLDISKDLTVYWIKL